LVLELDGSTRALGMELKRCYVRGSPREITGLDESKVRSNGEQEDLDEECGAVQI